MSFADLGVSRPVAGALAKRGITAPFAVQKLVIEDVLDGRDVLVQSPTGSGKTLAFGIPLVDLIEAGDRRPAALILAPTRELALQIVDELHDIATARALSVAPVYGGVGLETQAKRAARAHIVVATPGRLEDLLQRRAFTLDHVRVLVIDEADRMLDMGFKPAVDRIVAKTPRDRQTLFFSATLEAAAGKVARAYTSDARRHVHEPALEDVGEVEHRFVHVEHTDKVGALVDELRAGERGRTLVFVRTKRGADRLVKRLQQQGVEAVAMHGNKSQGQRAARARQLRRGQDRHPRRHRRCRPRHRRRGDHPRDQLRRARRSRRLRAPCRPFRPRGSRRRRDQLRDARPGRRDAPDRGQPRARVEFDQLAPGAERRFGIAQPRPQRRQPLQALHQRSHNGNNRSQSGNRGGGGTAAVAGRR